MKKEIGKTEFPAGVPWEQLLPALQSFAEQLKAKFSAHAPGDPEEQLRAPVEHFLQACGPRYGKAVLLKGESRLRERLGKVDYAVHVGKLLTGHVELKAPGKGANPDHFNQDHDRDQWGRFKSLPNLIYTDGNEWALYHSGKLDGRRVRMKGDLRSEGAEAVTRQNAKDLFQLLAAFFSWRPIVPHKPRELAEFLADYCKLIREEVHDALMDENSSLHSLRTEVQELLFPEATLAQFADAYAQTVIFALLLAHMEGADVRDLGSAYETLASGHLLLSRSLEFLTRDKPQEELRQSLSLAQRVIHEVGLSTLTSRPDRLIHDSTEEIPWLFFYEDFLAKYDPKMRKQWGAYYTPVEVARCQVRLIDEILARHLGRRMGFVEPFVYTLDPAVGTGTYLLTVFDEALERVKREEGEGSVTGAARTVAGNLYGFEWMVGPYAVAQLRFVRALVSRKVSLPGSDLGIYLTNTLESPHRKPPTPPLFTAPLDREHKRALRIKELHPVLICLGNPPYGRHVAAEEGNRAVTGGWVRHGDSGQRAILEDFLEPARKAGLGLHLKNLYNLYVYFVRWALWKVFENEWAPGPGIVSFITCSSYLDGDAFVGLREHMRRLCDHIDIIDLGGEGRGTRRDQNVFAIQTPVAIFIAWRKARRKGDTPARVRYTRIEGTRKEKLAAIDRIRSDKDKNLKWQECPSYWQAPFRPAPKGDFTRWPLLADLFPWQHSGVMAGRTWVIGESGALLGERWEALVQASSIEQRRKLFKESPTGRKIGDRPAQLPHQSAVACSVGELSPPTPTPEVVQFGFRSFDRQFILADNRLLDRPGPDLWHAHGDRQICLNTLVNHPLGTGPALSVTGHLPDKHFFRGSFGGNGVIPLYRDPGAMQANVQPGLTGLLSGEYTRAVEPEDLAGYVYAMLAQPEYTSRFASELSSCEVRVPLTKSGKLFLRAAEFGKRLIWLHTYGERMTCAARLLRGIPTGHAKCQVDVPGTDDQYPSEFRYVETTKTLFVGAGRFAPVEPAVFDFEVSGLKVVKSWLGYRMRERRGKKSSPLDDIRPRVWTHEFTRELLELLWVLEQTVEGYPEQKKLLLEALDGPLFTADELPPVPSESRRAPKVMRSTGHHQNNLSFG
ncbi:MAG: DNA methyltransferase [Planctomycetes bacterium]|nr:DNA methyltransferase [Planctomycetota bacterium]